MRFFQAETSDNWSDEQSENWSDEERENWSDEQSGEKLSACLEGTYWNRLPVEMQIEILKQVLSITFKLSIENPYFGRKIISNNFHKFLYNPQRTEGFSE